MVTEEQVIKALKCKTEKKGDCKKCPYAAFSNYSTIIACDVTKIYADALKLIKNLKKTKFNNKSKINIKVQNGIDDKSNN